MTSSASGPDLRVRLSELKQRFDAAFADPPPSAADEPEDLLVIAVSSERYLLRLREIEGLYLDRAITPVPSPLADLLGVTDFRGELVAVYDLGALLGYPRTQATRYLARMPNRGVGFAFEHFEGHLRFAKQGGELETHVQAIVDLPGLVDRLEQQAARMSAGET
jgi:purine-binding chemotaxis protein CheW